MAQVAILGCGNLGQAIIQSSLYSGIRKYNIKGSVFNNTTAKIIKHAYRLKDVGTHLDNGRIAANVDYIFISVKPLQVKSVLLNIKKFISPNQIIISTAAGVTIDYIEKYTYPNQRIIRCMPNLGITNGNGVVGMYSKNVDRTCIDDLGKTIFKGSKIFNVENENKIDVMTVLSGCGPAFISYFAKEMYIKGIECGLNPYECNDIIKYTFRGSGDLIQWIGFSEVIYKVASKGGSTEAGLKYLSINKVDKIFGETLDRSYHKIKSISRSLEEN